jgi:hypothetical protein
LHHSGFHVLDEPPAIDAYQVVVRVRVQGDLVCGLINIETFEVKVRAVALDGVFNAERRGVGDPLILRLERPGGLPIASDLLFSGVGLSSSGERCVVREK